MRKSTILLVALALALIPLLQHTVVATPPQPQPQPQPPPHRRSRFLGSVKFPPPPSSYDCSKNPPSICRSLGSPGATCCEGSCVDTEYSFKHCGDCHKTCHYTETCCEGKCVNTFTDKKNCGGCGVKCRTKCDNGVCDYAA